MNQSRVSHASDHEASSGASSSLGSAPPVDSSEISLLYEGVDTDVEIGPSSGRIAAAIDALDVTGHFLAMVLKKLPDAIDSNPVKVAFSLAKIVLELKEVSRSNTSIFGLS